MKDVFILSVYDASAKTSIFIQFSISPAHSKGQIEKKTLKNKCRTTKDQGENNDEGKKRTDNGLQSV